MTPWLRIGLILGLAVISFASGWHVKSVFDKAAQEKQVIIAQGNVITTERKQTATSNEVEHAYQSKVNALDLIYGHALDGLQSSRANDMPPISNPAGGNHANACPARFSRSSKISLVNLMKQADIQTQRLIACQSWISREGK